VPSTPLVTPRSGALSVYTMVDFNRLRRAGKDEAIPAAAAIFIDVLNIFLFLLQLFGRRS
jgi:FtsH-binding integral membrane protein